MMMNFDSVELICVAYQAGIDAYSDGRDEESNPWTTVTLQGHAWERGFLKAERDAEND